MKSTSRPSVPVIQNISLRSFGMHRKQNLERVFGKYFSCSRAKYTCSERNFCAISLLEHVSKRFVSKRICIDSETTDKNDDLISTSRDVDPHGRLWQVQGGQIG